MMRLYHFDARGEGGTLATESRLLSDVDAARKHAVQVASSLAGQSSRFDQDGGALVLEVYTAEDGVVLTIRLFISIEKAGPGKP